ncbi:MAG: hypothetical protein QOG73_4474 [Acetobacteraceae bacterium]|jgi:hypothetical protein|nr:hypothetical protein [Acetobacteraceae bacterium]
MTRWTVARGREQRVSDRYYQATKPGQPPVIDQVGLGTDGCSH